MEIAINCKFIQFFKIKYAQSSIVSYFCAIFYVFYNYRKLFMSLFFTNFVDPDPDLDPYFFISWIRIRKKGMRIHSHAD